MKIDGNHPVLRTVYIEQGVQGAGVNRTKAADGSFAASFEKNRNDCVVEQSGHAGKAQGADGQTAVDSSNAMSKLEILNNLVTERDLKQFKKHSEELEEEELDVIVTVVEKIKTQLAVYCDDFDSGMTKELSSEELATLSHITGNAAHVAKKLKDNNLPVTEENVSDVLSAMELNDKTGSLTDDAKEYCMKADLELSIENLYMAMHSGNYEGVAGYYSDGSGYYARAAENTDITQLLPQIERVLVQSGIEPDEKTMGQAQWLIERQLPLTKENLLKLQQLDRISSEEDTQEAVLEHIVDALLEGRRSAQATLGENESVRARSEQAVSVVENTTDEHLKAVIASGQEITIEKLVAAQADYAVTEADNAAGRADYADASSDSRQMEAVLSEDNITFITARRQLEEVRLQMTVESVAVMLRNGISVETESLSQLIEQLKRVEEQYYAQLLTGNKIEASQTNISLYKEITAATANIGQAPAALIGTVAFAETELAMEAVSAEGTLLAEKYKHAGKAYETVMTKPRSDMGDSIQKAFQNVDDILEDMGIEVNRENQRAVRILGYNSIEITEENIMKVKHVDMEITAMLENMKPKAVLEMIREGYNPLDKTAGQINRKLAEYKQNSQDSQENFSEFLWNIEHKEGISREERNAYIGIYRMLHQIERSDGSVVGAVLEQGAALTIRNLMTGIRSAKHKAMDYKIGEIDGIEGTKSGSITQQVEEGYLGLLAGRMQSDMAAADWSAVEEQEFLMDMSMETFADYIRSVGTENAGQESYTAGQLELLRQAGQSEEQILTHLSDMNQPVTIRNILAAAQLYRNRGGCFRQIKDYAQQDEESQMSQTLLENMAEAEESFTDKASARNAYDKLLKTAMDVVETGMQSEEITFEQMRNWKLLSGQLRLAGNLSEKEEYHVPVEIAGELTSVHVRFVQGEGIRGKVAISFDTDATGKVTAEFTEKEGRMEGYIVTAFTSLKELLAGRDGELRQQVENSCGMSVGKIDYVQHEQLDLMRFSSDVRESDADSTVSGASLYQVAKTVIGFVKTITAK